MDHRPTWTDPKGCTCSFDSENCPTLATLRWEKTKAMVRRG